MMDGALDGAFTFSMDILEARDWEEFKDALSHFNGFVWNWVYADREGNIGFKISGMIPIRAKGDGLEPVPGWSGEFEWTGVIPFDELPELFNPDSGYVFTANNEISDAQYPHTILGTAFVLPYRSMRIEELILTKVPATYEGMRDIQADTNSKFGLIIAGFVIEAVDNLEVEDERIQELVGYLEGWDGSTGVDSVGITIAFEVFVQTMENLYGNKLDDVLYQQFLEQIHYSVGVCLLMLYDESYFSWYDDPETGAIEGRDDLLVKSLRDADEALSSYFGNNIEKWKWGKIHTYTFKHALGTVPPFKWLWNIGPFEFPGDISTINPGYFTDISRKPYEVTDGSSMRHIIDFGDFDGAKLVITTGESERWLSPYYDNQTGLWMDVQYLPMWMDREDIEENAKALLIFEPEK